MVTGLVAAQRHAVGRGVRLFGRGDDAFWKNTQWTQRANFIEMPTDCPQRDERLGWMGDAQAYARTATYNADVASFFTKWLDDVVEAQRDFGPYPDYCPVSDGARCAGPDLGNGVDRRRNHLSVDPLEGVRGRHAGAGAASGRR
jgi:hypothetical protein